MKTYKCQYCTYKVNENKNNKGVKSAKFLMGKHYDETHKQLLPKDMDGYRFFYFLLTKRDRGSCAMCHKETEFNKANMKYSRFCDNPKCKQDYVEQVKGRMLGKYGKVHLLDDPDMQKKMQSGRRIAGIYTWSDGKTKTPYLSSYEEDFLRFLDINLKWSPSDVFGPSPHTYTYIYEGKEHFYMPDFFIASLNLEVEIKDDGSALNINADSRAKDKIKDELMRSMGNVFNYIKIINKDYTDFKKIITKEE